MRLLKQQLVEALTRQHRWQPAAADWVAMAATMMINSPESTGPDPARMLIFVNRLLDSSTIALPIDEEVSQRATQYSFPLASVVQALGDSRIGKLSWPCPPWFCLPPAAAGWRRR